MIAKVTYNLSRFILGILIILPPFFFHANSIYPFRFPKLVLSTTLALSVVGLLIFNLEKLKLDKEEFIAIGLVVWFGFTAMLSRVPLSGIEKLLNVIIWLFFYIVVKNSLNLTHLGKILKLIRIPALILSLVLFAKVLGIDFFIFVDPIGARRMEYGVFMGNPADLALYLLVAFFIVTVKPTRVDIVIATVIVGAIFLTQTLTAVVSLFIGVLTLVYYRSYRFFLPVLVTSVIVFLAFFLLVPRFRDKLKNPDINSLLTGRLDGWKVAKYMIEENPLTGVGFGGFKFDFALYKESLLSKGETFYKHHRYSYFTHAHNEYLQIAAETGLVGFLSLLYLIYTLLKKATLEYIPLLISLVVAATTFFVFHLAVITYPLSLALVLALNDTKSWKS